MSEAAPVPEKLPADAAAELSRRISALEDQGGDGAKPETQSHAWVVAFVVSFVVALVLGLGRFALQRLKLAKGNP